MLTTTRQTQTDACEDCLDKLLTIVDARLLELIETDYLSSNERHLYQFLTYRGFDFYRDLQTLRDSRLAQEELSEF